MKAKFLRAALLLLICTSFVLSAGTVGAVEPGEILKDPKLEARARELSAELRCLVCQNQSIDDSDAPLAKDLRLLVRERLQAGDTNAEVLDFVVARYGEFVLLRPPVSWHTAPLWGLPFVLLLIGGLVIFYLYRRGVNQSAALPENGAAAVLSEDEKARLNELLRDD